MAAATSPAGSGAAPWPSTTSRSMTATSGSWAAFRISSTRTVASSIGWARLTVYSSAPRSVTRCRPPLPGLRFVAIGPSRGSRIRTASCASVPPAYRARTAPCPGRSARRHSSTPARISSAGMLNGCGMKGRPSSIARAAQAASSSVATAWTVASRALPHSLSQQRQHARLPRGAKAGFDACADGGRGGLADHDDESPSSGRRPGRPGPGRSSGRRPLPRGPDLQPRWPARRPHPGTRAESSPAGVPCPRPRRGRSGRGAPRWRNPAGPRSGWRCRSRVPSSGAPSAPPAPSGRLRPPARRCR